MNPVRVALALVAILSVALPARAEAIRIGVLKLASYCPTFVAQERGYFAAAGLEAALVLFVTAEPIAVAVASGDLDIGTAGISAGLYNLAGQGELRIIAAGAREAPGYPDIAIVASNRASEDGLTGLADLAGRSFAFSQIGSPTHYGLGRIADKYGIDLTGLRLLPLQTIPNQVVAVVRGQADAGIIPATAVMPALTRGEVQLLGWLGDVAPFQAGVAFVSSRTADERSDLVERYLVAFRRGSRDCHDAFSGAGEQRRDGKTAPEILAILAKYTSQPDALLRLGIAYEDAGARLDVQDIERQVAWFRGQNLVKPGEDGAMIIDRRYAVPLPER